MSRAPLPATASLDPSRLQLAYFEHGGEETRFYLLVGLPGQAPSIGASGVVGGSAEHPRYRGCRVWVRDELEATGRAWADALRADPTLKQYRAVGGRAVSPRSGSASASGALPVAFDPAHPAGRSNLGQIWTMGAALAARRPEERMEGNGIPDLHPVVDDAPIAWADPSSTPVAPPTRPRVVTADPDEGESTRPKTVASGAEVYASISALVISMLEGGSAPWRKPWVETGGPRNIAGRRYRGINAFLLGITPYASPFWLTFRQALERGGSVRAGERALPVIWWDQRIREEEDEQTGEKRVKRYPLLRSYAVFNVEQCDGITPPPLPEANLVAFDPLEAAETIVTGYADGPELAHHGDRAYYSPQRDQIVLPAREAFASAEGYYATLFHEFGHSTGHSSRLDRPGVAGFDHFGSGRYGREELVAEMTAALLCNEARIAPATIENSAAYLASWIRSIREDGRILVAAAAAAQRSADRVLGRTVSSEEPTTSAA